MTKGNVLPGLDDLPNLDQSLFALPTASALQAFRPSAHAPRILLLYGSVRERSYSRLLSEEAARLLQAMGAETKTFDPSGLPLPDDAPDTHPKVQELRQLAQWAEGMVWTSPERHGAMTGIMKSQIDWIPLAQGALRPTQGKTLALMQVSGGSQSFRRQPAARAGALDAHADHSEPVLRRQGLPRVRRSRAHEAVSLLRPRGGCDGRTGQVHAAHA